MGELYIVPKGMVKLGTTIAVRPGLSLHKVFGCQAEDPNVGSRIAEFKQNRQQTTAGYQFHVLA